MDDLGHHPQSPEGGEGAGGIPFHSLAGNVGDGDGPASHAECSRGGAWRACCWKSLLFSVSGVCSSDASNLQWQQLGNELCVG